MDIEKRFIDLKFLDENVIERNRSILKNTFDIDIDNLISLIRNEIDIVNINMDAQLKLIHQYVIESMKEYNINISKCFSRSSVQSNRFIDIYLIENLKLNIYLYYINKSKEHKYISQIEAVKNYISIGTDENEKTYYLIQNEKTSDISEIEDKKIRLRDYSRIITMNIKKIKKMDERYERLISLFINESSDKNRNKDCYNIVSNVFIEMMDNIFKTGYANTMAKILEQKKLRYNYDIALKRMQEFFDKNVDYEEKYFWERINNTIFIQSLYYSVKNIESEFKEQQDLFQYLFPVIYLPNVFMNQYFLQELIFIYKNEQAYYKYKGKFEENVKKMCLHLAFLIIPLYNKIFSIVIYELNKKSEIKLESDITEEDLKQRIEMCYRQYELINKDRKQFDVAEFLLLSSNIIEKINFDIFELNKLIDFIGSFDKDFLKIIKNSSNYKMILKEFILKTIFNNEI